MLLSVLIMNKHEFIMTSNEKSKDGTKFTKTYKCKHCHIGKAEKGIIMGDREIPYTKSGDLSLTCPVKRS